MSTKKPVLFIDFYEILQSKSTILHPCSDPKKPPQSGGHFDMSLDNYYEHLVNSKNGWLQQTKEELKKAKDDSDYFDSTQTKKIPQEKRYNESEKIQKLEARLAVYRQERLCIEKKMREIKVKEKKLVDESKPNGEMPISPRNWGLRGKLKLMPNGSQRLRLMDGRKVIQNKKDEDVFEDTGQLISEYHDWVMEQRQKYFAKKEIEDKAEMKKIYMGE